MTINKIDWYENYSWKNDGQEYIIPGYQLIELLNFWQENGKKCSTLLECFKLFKGVE